MKLLRNLMILALSFTFLLLFEAASYAGMDSGMQPLVDTHWLAQMKHIILVDVRDKDVYLEGHIPDAVSIPLSDLQSKPDAIPYPVGKLNEILGEYGLNMDSDVVLYGEGKEIAYREYWILDYLGMKHIHVLDGGIDAWKGRLSTSVKTLPPSSFTAKPDQYKYATTQYLRGHLHASSVILLDVRTAGEYIGTDVRSLRGGHIPGAININFEQNYEPGTTILKPVSELAKIYSKLAKSKEIITYCQTGTRAANSYFVLRKLLGFPKVRNYPDSWVVWGTRLDLPAEDVSYFNFVTVLKAIKELEKQQKK